MPIQVQIPQAMRQHADGQATVDLAGANVKEVLDNLGVKFPNIVGRIFDNGQLRRFVNIYLNDEDIRYIDQLGTKLKDGDSISILPASSPYISRTFPLARRGRSASVVTWRDATSAAGGAQAIATELNGVANPYFNAPARGCRRARRRSRRCSGG